VAESRKGGRERIGGPIADYSCYVGYGLVTAADTATTGTLPVKRRTRGSAQRPIALRRRIQSTQPEV
jgi:hypothetical protein